MSTFGKAPQWGSAWKAFIKENADRANTAYLQKTTLPYEDNYLDLDPDGERSARVIPCAGSPPTSRRTSEPSPRSSRTRWPSGIAPPARLRPRNAPVGTMGPSTHAYGGTRMGDNSETNVVNRWGFSHEVPNLGVLGASTDGNQRRQKPDTDGSGVGLADGRLPDEELEADQPGKSSQFAKNLPLRPVALPQTRLFPPVPFVFPDGELFATSRCGRKLIMSAYDSVLEVTPQPLGQFAQEPGCSDGIDFQSLEIGTTIHVHTRYSSYHLVVTDPENGGALVTGGRLFLEPTPIRVEGATAGGSAIKAGWIGVGLHLELLKLTNRVTTSVVRAVKVEMPRSPQRIN